MASRFDDPDSADNAATTITPVLCLDAVPELLAAAKALVSDHPLWFSLGRLEAAIAKVEGR